MALGLSGFPRLKMDAGAISRPSTLKSVKPALLPKLRNLTNIQRRNWWQRAGLIRKDTVPSYSTSVTVGHQIPTGNSSTRKRAKNVPWSVPKVTSLPALTPNGVEST
jgi:hypothetical protein